MKKVARWSHLVELYKLEAEGLVKMLKLTEAYFYPKPIERKSVATCLRVFCKETYTGIINHPGMRNVDGRGYTAAFIKIVVNWWKILNIKSRSVDVRFNNKLQATNSLPEILLRQYIIHAMVLSVCADFCSESRIIMFYWEHFRQIP